MRLDSDDLTELAGFFAKRFPAAADRRALAADAGLRPDRDPMAAPGPAWLTLLGQAHAQGRLRLLAHAVARRAPDDDNLRGVCQVLTGSATPGTVPLWDHPRTAPALAAVAVALLGLTAVVAFRDPAPADIDVVLAAAPVAPAAPTPGAEPGLVAIEGGATPAGASKPWKAGNPLDTPRAAAPEATPTPAAPPRAAAPAHYEGRCTVKGGGIVGYWYAGDAAPAQAGGLLVMPHSVNVRADYPDQHNDFDARAPLRCQLAEGDRVRLTADPIAVPGGAFWVPLHSGDLQGG